MRVTTLKACTTCSELKPLTAFYRRRLGPDGHKNVCSDCEKARRLVRMAEKDPNFRPKTVYNDPEGYKTCRSCKVLKDAAEFYRQSGKGDGLQNQCKACARKRQARHRDTEGYKRNQRVRQARSRGERDVVRRVMSDAPPTLIADEEQLAYVRGFLRGRSVQDEESARVSECQDLVFRIASDLKRSWGGVTFEDLVGYGYEGLLEGIRTYRLNAKHPFRSHASNRIRFGILDKLRQAGTTWRIGGRNSEISSTPETCVNGDGRVVNPVDDGKLAPVVVDEQHDDQIGQQLERISEDLTPRHAEIVRLRLEGMTDLEVGQRLGISGSYVCMLRGEIRALESAPEQPSNGSHGGEEELNEASPPEP